MIEVQGHRVVLKANQWSRWTRLDFELAMPLPVPAKHVSGICRFYLQEVTPNFRLYVTPVNIDPSAPAGKISEPPSFIQDVSERLGLFPTIGFQEDCNVRMNRTFADDEFVRQAEMVLEERIALLDYALENYDDGLLFFYFSSVDRQSHMLWWDTDERHPTRAAAEAKQCFHLIRRLYQRLDAMVGRLVNRYGNRATILVLSDHGFANFRRQFNLNSWLRSCGYLGPPEAESLTRDVDWSRSAAYGLGINGLYLNLKGRERDGVVEPGEQQEKILAELVGKLEAVRDVDGRRVIRKVYRADQVYSGNATALAPDLIVGYCRGYRSSWATCLGDLEKRVLEDNPKPWCADHCADAMELPGVLFSSRPIRAEAARLVDMAPSILAEFGLPTPSSMEGRDVFSS